MKDALARNAKPGAGTPGFAQSTWRLVASYSYRFGVAGANAYVRFPALALDGAGYGAALLRGGPMQ